MKHFASLTLIALLTVPSFGATIAVGSGDNAYYLALNRPDAKCLIEELGDTGIEEASCTAGEYFVTATVEWGCGDSLGPTYCSSVTPGEEPSTASELRCTERKSYVLIAGDGDMWCKQSDGEKSCESLDGGHFAEATCASGCGTVRGASVCCLAGTDGCPPPSGTTEAE